MPSLTDATTTTTADDLIYQEIIDTNVIDAAWSTRVMAPLMKQVSLVGKPSDTHKFPRWPALTAASVAETADLTNTNIATTSVSVTVGEVGITIAVTDNTTEDDILSGLAEYGRNGGLALADKMDADAAALLSGFSNATGDGTADLSVATLIDGIAALEARDAPKPYVGALHTVQWHQLSKDIATSSASIWSQGGGQGDSRLGAKPGFVGNFFGVDLYQSTNVPADGQDTQATPANVYDGAIFSKEQALAWVNKRDARSEMERDASARLTEITITSRYGVGEIVDEYGENLMSARA